MDKYGKKAKFYASTPMGEGSSEWKEFPAEEPVAPERKRSKLEMVCEAIESVGSQKKGASYQAIRSYVLSQHEASESARATVFIRKAILKGIDDGILARPNSSKNVVGAKGYFTLVKKSSKPKITKKSKDASKEPKKTKMPTEQVSDSEATTKKTKPKKLNSSDTVVMDLKKVKPKKKPITKPNSEPPKATVKKSEEKEVKNNETAKKTKIKKNVAERRQDVSDSEIVVKKANRKSLKSYSSDTEVEVARKDKPITLKKAPKKTGTKAATSKQKAAEPLQPPKASRAREQKKLYKSEKQK